MRYQPRPGFRAIVSTRSTSAKSLSEIFEKASAMRKACQSNATDLVANYTVLVSDCALKEFGNRRVERGGYEMQPASADAILAVLVFEFAEKSLRALPSSAWLILRRLRKSRMRAPTNTSTGLGPLDRMPPSSRMISQ